ncbi:MAG: hypothetical protein NPIRA04_02670 [Nitrospirales bacterium]|nr:MAG: hypothetical protein NPIRA04_02670 [Nitrospirales bacterium]
MCCERCGGLMVVDVCLDMRGDDAGVWISTWRCVNCGESINSKILQNRVKSQRAEPPSPISQLTVA